MLTRLKCLTVASSGTVVVLIDLIQSSDIIMYM